MTPVRHRRPWPTLPDLDVPDLADLLAWLPEDPRPDVEVADVLLDTLLRTIEPLDTEWRDHYWTLLKIFQAARSLDLHDADQRMSRRVLEGHAWRLAHALGLDIAQELPWPMLPDADGRLAVRDSALLWCRFTRVEDPWEDLDLRPVRRLVDGSQDPLLRALWRVATRSRLDQLHPRHRESFDRARVGRLGLARLAVDEARDLVASTGRIESLEAIDAYLHDPVLQSVHAEATLGLLGLAVLAQARAHLHDGNPLRAAGFLKQWAKLGEHVEPSREAQAEANEIRARLDLEAGDHEAAERGIGRGLMALADRQSLERQGLVPRMQRAELFALYGEHLRSSHPENAVAMLEQALTQVRTQARYPTLHVEIAHSLTAARWAHCVNDLHAADFYSRDGLSDAAGRALAQHRPAMERALHDLERAAPDVFRIDSALVTTLHRWHLGRALCLDDPHQAIATMATAARDLFGHAMDARCGALATDMLLALRLCGWSPSAILDTGPIRRLVDTVPAMRDHLATVIAGERHPLLDRTPTDASTDTDVLFVH